METQRCGSVRGMPFQKQASLILKAIYGFAFVFLFTLGGANQTGFAAESGGEPPRHPFPQWVGKLKTGESTAETVTARFGPPDEIEGRAQGGQIWRYQLAEIQWPEDDPNRPDISAEGQVPVELAPPVEFVWNGSKAVVGWFARNLFFPPLQPRPTASRRVPATLHRLELIFESDEVLLDYRYASGQGDAQVPDAS